MFDLSGYNDTKYKDRVFFKENAFINFLKENNHRKNVQDITFKLITPQRFDFLINGIEYFYHEFIKNTEVKEVPLIYCLHENYEIEIFIYKLRELLEKNHQEKKTIILFTNCELKIETPSNFYIYNTNHLLNFYTTTAIVQQKTIIPETEIGNHLKTPKTKKLFSLNKNVTQDRPHRVKFISWLIHNNFIDDCLVSTLIKPDAIDESIFNTPYQEINQLKKSYWKYLDMDRIILDWDCEIDEDSNLSLQNDTKSFYYETPFSIVSETSFNNDRIFISEKTGKPIKNLHPFIILGDSGIHQKLKELGFILYDDIIDYSFDSIHDNELRMIKFFEQVEMLIKQSDNIQEWYKKNVDKIIYNFEHLKNNFNEEKEYEKNIEYLINFRL